MLYSRFHVYYKLCQFNVSDRPSFAALHERLTSYLDDGNHDVEGSCMCEEGSCLCEEGPCMCEEGPCMCEEGSCLYEEGLLSV